MSDYEKLKVAALRALLKERNIPSTGLTRKAQFIEKLREADAAAIEVATYHTEQVSAVADPAADTNPTPGAAPTSHETMQPVEEDSQNMLVAEDSQNTLVAEDSQNMLVADTEAATPPTNTGASLQAEAEVIETPDEQAQQPPIHSQDEMQPSESLTETLSQTTHDPAAEENKKRKRDESLSTMDEAKFPTEERHVAKKAKAGEESLSKTSNARETEETFSKTSNEQETAALSKTSNARETEEAFSKTSNEQETAASAAVEASVDDNAADTNMKGAEPDDARSVTNTPIPAVVKTTPPKQGPSARKDLRFESLFKTEPMTDNETLTSSMTDEVPTPEKSIHPVTRALYIRGFTRPLLLSWLQDHAVAIATPQGAEVTARIIELEQQAKTADDEQRSKTIENELAAKKIELDQASKTVEFVYIDTIRSHAFLLFSSTSAAERARAFLHGTVWPKHTWRSAVWVDFIPEDKLHEWVATEKDKNEVSRWEVAYSKTRDGHVEATLQPAQMQNRKESNLGTRVSARSPTRTMSTAEHTHPQQGPAQDRLFATLDQKFRWTKAKPKLYWRTVPNEAVSKRSDNLQTYKSVDWDPRNVRMSDEFRRYTFDGNALVYAGPHSLGPRAREREGLPPIRGGRRGGYRRR